MQQNQNQQQPQVDLNKLEDYKCECGHDQFQMVYELKKVPRFYTNSGREEYATVQLLKCLNCDKTQYELSGLKKGNNEEKTKQDGGNEGDGIIRPLK